MSLVAQENPLTDIVRESRARVSSEEGRDEAREVPAELGRRALLRYTRLPLRARTVTCA